MNLVLMLLMLSVMLILFVMLMLLVMLIVLMVSTVLIVWIGIPGVQATSVHVTALRLCCGSALVYIYTLCGVEHTL